MKNLLSKITLLLATFCAGARRFLRDNVEPVVKALSIVKDALNSPIADIITNLTKTQLDNLALAQVRRWLPIAISSLQIPILLSEKNTVEEMLQVLTNYLKELPPAIQNATLAKLATILSQLKAGGSDLKESEIDLLVHLAVQRLKHGAKD